MRKITFIFTVLMVIAVCDACAGPGAADNTPPSAGAGEPNAWVVTSEAPVKYADTGEDAGIAFGGFCLSLHSVSGDAAQFSINFFDENGENIKETKTYAIDIKHMEKKYVEPKAVIEMISIDMIELKPNAVLYDENGAKLISFNDPAGPFRFIQKTDKGYMFTIDMNIVFAKENDVNYIPVKIP